MLIVILFRRNVDLDVLWKWANFGPERTHARRPLIIIHGPIMRQIMATLPRQIMIYIVNGHVLPFLQVCSSLLV